MLRFGIFLAAAVALSTAAPQGISDNVIELDLSPEEAAKYLSNPPFTEPRLSALVKTLPLVKYDDPRFRSAEAGPTLGHYWRNGHEIENPDAYVEEVYNAYQFHGQDGLGAYAYGYETPESSKVENRVRSGDVTGSYTFKGDNNELIKVRYWSDSEGFHQEDNIPKVVLKPVEEAEDVRQARLAHEKAWAEAAAAARQNPDPQGDYYKQYDYQPAASELSGSVVAAPGEAREGKAYNGQFPSYPPSPKPEKYEEPEPTGPPRGFFYKFDYPVSIIVPKNPEEKNPSFNVRNIPY
ncbi:uncharacterized protein LOC112045772 isoform X1 [Bicyclus anynana]|uniref:Uncharacterized protein LOC112045772 isoform X1 n=1 Tax=Bicyclus anynana TaxID=110368 RepID=A0A6J1MQF6_BICAN|nr:uncharacterized protein LOC112045772 isoform X1 [Bicyclus anynana]